ncbi:hypothetical protein [Actinomadura sp. NPDC048394]|uniref:hypothetical protein n=1 Tax=Actinomadura sp. NPDC048394 TaxID=3158223 RepID=UPI0033D9A46C
MSMAMGGEFCSSDEEPYSKAWKISRELGVQVAAHVAPGRVSGRSSTRSPGHRGSGKDLGVGGDTLFIHMTGVSDTEPRPF